MNKFSRIIKSLCLYIGAGIALCFSLGLPVIFYIWDDLTSKYSYLREMSIPNAILTCIGIMIGWIFVAGFGVLVCWEYEEMKELKQSQRSEPGWGINNPKEAKELKWMKVRWRIYCVVMAIVATFFGIYIVQEFVNL